MEASNESLPVKTTPTRSVHKTRGFVLLLSGTILIVATLWLRLGAAQASHTDKYCGHVRGEGTTFRVDVFRGAISCPTARGVIRYVLTHGSPTQASPGVAPRGWSCGYGYGFYHGHHNQSGRVGPICTRRQDIIQATQAGYTLPAEHHLRVSGALLDMAGSVRTR